MITGSGELDLIGIPGMRLGIKPTFHEQQAVVAARGILSGKVGTGMCGPDRVLFRSHRFTNGPFFI